MCAVSRSAEVQLTKTRAMEEMFVADYVGACLGPRSIVALIMSGALLSPLCAHRSQRESHATARLYRTPRRTPRRLSEDLLRDGLTFSLKCKTRNKKCQTRRFDLFIKKEVLRRCPRSYTRIWIHHRSKQDAPPVLCFPLVSNI